MKTLILKFNSQKWYENGGVYHDGLINEGKPSEDLKTPICGHFIQKILGEKPESIKVKVTNKNPKNKGWFAVEFEREFDVFIPSFKRGFGVNSQIPRYIQKEGGRVYVKIDPLS